MVDADGEDQTATTAYFFHGGRNIGANTNSASFGSVRQPSGSMPGLSFFRNRVYDQATGRWTQEDPTGVAGGVNLYQFNGNNPVAYTDPYGLCPDACVVEGGTALVAIGVGVVATAYAIQHGDELGDALAAGGRAAAGVVTGVISWMDNAQAKLKANGEIRVINQHLDWLGGGGKGADPGPNDRDKWKKDVQRHLRELRKFIDKMKGDKNKAPFEEHLKRLTDQASKAE